MSKEKPDIKIHLPTADFVRQCVRSYYSTQQIPVVSHVQNREFGSILPGRSMWRHIAMRDMNALQDFLVTNCPAHMYYSSAYYEKPGARTMLDKVWQGADLIFDLDADHIPGAEELSYKEMLESVKEQFIKLLDDFLLKDFGFEQKDIGIYFSGGRGYHAHVRHESVKKLNSHERREIVNYITLPEKDISRLVRMETYDVTEYKGRFSKKEICILPDPESSGWKRKLRNGLFEYLDEGQDRERKAIVKELVGFEGIGKKGAEDIWTILFDGDTETCGAANIKRSNRLEAFDNDQLRDKFLRFILDRRTRKMAGETDEPVTSDIKRLIRLPGSLHGKTGFMVVELGLDDLKDFDPLKDTVWKGFTGETDMMVLADHDFELLGENWKLKKGEEITLPTAAAFHVILQRKARVG
ncbi:MAG: DNA primase catalytic subunit PriS [Thermoplasmata archaeon]|nr:DNA primase catalytic subunit PriS [Thermoplasmata archaeon]